MKYLSQRSQNDLVSNSSPSLATMSVLKKELFILAFVALLSPICHARRGPKGERENAREGKRKIILDIVKAEILIQCSFSL
jgi:hypothetical protein